jgi:hypothetical protein
MTFEDTPGSVDTDGTLLVLIVPEDGLADPRNPKLSELTATTVKRITYSLTPDGWAHTTNEDSGTDDRLTLPTSFESRGKVTDSLEVGYVYGAEDDVADPLLVPGFRGFAVARYAVENSVDLAADQEVDVIPFEAGVKRRNPPAANAKWSKTQKLFVRAPGVQRDVKIVAGA